ncbi:MAG: hypothetical protein ACYTG0_08005 [Planctomycetota bacterium]
MDVQTAELVLYAIVVVEAGVWLCGLRFLLNSRPARDDRLDDRFDMERRDKGDFIVGSVEVDGDPADLAAKAAVALAKGDVNNLGPLKILERTDDGIVFEGGTPDLTGRTLGRWVRRGEIRFVGRQRGGTEISYRIGVVRGGGLLWTGAAMQLAGLIAIVVGFYLIRTHVVPHPNAAVRAQTFQMVQAGHFLWPPFLAGGLCRMRSRALRGAFDTLIHNLPHHGD